MSKGVDARTVKLPKSIKRMASTISNSHERGEFIRMHVQVIENLGRQRPSRDNNYQNTNED